MAGGEEKKVRTIKYRDGVNLWLFPARQEVAPPRTCLTFSCASIFSVRLQSSATWCTSCICGKPLLSIHLLIFHMVTTPSCCWLPEWWKVGQRLCSSLQISSRYKSKKQKPNLWVKPSQTVIGLSLACNPLWLHFPFFRRSAWMVRGFIIIVIVFFPLFFILLLPTPKISGLCLASECEGTGGTEGRRLIGGGSVPQSGAMISWLTAYSSCSGRLCGINRIIKPELCLNPNWFFFFSHSQPDVHGTLVVVQQMNP